MISRNREQVIFNPYQGKAKKVLCVCSAGVLRSPTAAVVLQREYGYNTRAAGIEYEYALIPVEDGLISWADEVICMDARQEDHLEVMMIGSAEIRKIISLGIPDSFDYMNERLQKLIIERYKEQTD